MKKIPDSRLPIADCRGRAAVLVGLVAAGWLSAEVPRRDYLGLDVGLRAAELGRPGAVFTNPAGLGFLRASGLELSYGLRIAQEERTRIVYDQFENSLGEATYADNIHAFGVPGPASGAARFGRFAAGAGLAVERDFNYSYLKEYRDDFYVKIGEDRVEQTGMVYSASAAAAFRPLEWASIGAAGRYLFGRRELDVWNVSGTDTAHVSEQGRPTGYGWTAGLALRPVRALDVAVGFASGVRLSGWSTGALPPESDGSRQYPWRAELGLVYRAPGVLPSVASAQVAYAAWHSADTTLTNTFRAQLGVEHLMLNLVRLRYGLGVDPHPAEPSVQTAGFDFGVGFDVEKYQIDLGGRTSRDVIGADLFRVPLAQSDAKTYETRTALAVTVSRGF